MLVAARPGASTAGSSPSRRPPPAAGWDAAWLRRWLRDRGRPPARGPWTLVPDFREALATVQDGAGTVLVTGSFHTVGDVMDVLGFGV